MLALGNPLALKANSDYILLMPRSDRLSPSEVEAARIRRLAAMRLQVLEGNPLSADQVAMFEMFEREAWTHERRLDFIIARAAPLAAE